MASSALRGRGRVPAMSTESFHQRLMLRALKRVKQKRAESVYKSRTGSGVVDTHALATMILTESAIHNSDSRIDNDDDDDNSNEAIIMINESSHGEGGMIIHNETSSDSYSTSLMDCPSLYPTPRYETKEDLDVFFGTVEYQEMLCMIEAAISREIAAEEAESYQNSTDTFSLTEGHELLCTPDEGSYTNNSLICPFCMRGNLLFLELEASCGTCGQNMHLARTHNGDEISSAEGLRVLLAGALDCHSSSSTCLRIPIFSTHGPGSLLCHCFECGFGQTIM